MSITRRDALVTVGAGLAGVVNAQALSAQVAPTRSAQHFSDMAPNKAASASVAYPIPSLPPSWQVVTYSVLLDGRLAILGADVDLRREWQRDQDGMMLGNPHRVAAGASARIWIFDGSSLAEGPIFPLLSPYPAFDRFADGRWLVASTRAFEEPNARILTTKGAEVRRIRLGDGIEHLKIDEVDRIWVGWFDEGIFGNDGWHVPGREWPPSNSGLAAFDEEGAVVALAELASSSGLIADCYALNVIEKTAWACPYTDFPILACDGRGRSRWWPTALSGPRAIAVCPPYVVAAGGYAKDGNRVVLVRLDEKRGEIVEEWRLPFEVGFPDAVALIDARGDQLHVVEKEVWHRWRVQDFIF